MNGAKIQLSPEPAGGQGPVDDGIYHNIKNEPLPGWDLSPQEMELVRDGALILAKNRVITRTVALFAELGGHMQEQWAEALSQAIGRRRYRRTAERRLSPDKEKGGLPQSEDTPDNLLLGELRELGRGGPKISRGENYKGFPWVVLDYPRGFGREDVFAIRSLFWWGHYFSVTLHLKGKYKDLFLPVIRSRIPLLAGAGFHICISADEWRHELAADHYSPLEGMAPEALDHLLDRPGFLKFSAVTALEHGGAPVTNILQLYDTVIQALV